MSVYKVKNGWRVSVSYKDSMGKYRKKTAIAKSKKEALLLESSIKARRSEEPVIDIYFNAVALDFIETAKREKRLTTAGFYIKQINNHILPFFDKMKFSSITRQTILDWKDYVIKEGNTKNPDTGYSLNTLKHCYQALHAIFKHATRTFGIKNDSIDRVENFAPNPNAIDEDNEEEKFAYWKPEEFKTWLKTCERMIEENKKKKRAPVKTYEATKILCALCCLAGLRKGEANALLVRDFHDGDKPYLDIRKSVSQQLGKLHKGYLYTPPKNKTSVRKVPVCDELAVMLRNHINEYLKHIPNCVIDNLYLTYGLKPLPNSNARTIKNKIEKEANIPHVHIHQLRHSFITMLLMNGVNVSVVAKLGGHATTKMTYSIYCHLYPETGEEAIHKLDKILADNP